MLSVVFNSVHRKTLAEAADDVSFVDSSADFSEPAFVVRILEDEFVEENSPWDMR